MTKETLKLCYYASEVYQSKKYSANLIYRLLINTQSRKKEVTKARQLVSYFLYNKYNLTLKEVAKEINLINHTSVIYHVDQVFYSLKTDKRMKFRHDYVLDNINGIKRTLDFEKPISKKTLNQEDKDYISQNIHLGYSVSYFADILVKNKTPVRLFLQSLKRESKKTSKLETFSFAKQQYFKIDF